MIPANRDINKLSENFKLKVIDFLEEVWDIIFITEWFRTVERQLYLYAQWRYVPYKDEPKVTRTTSSNHQLWLAIDIAFYWKELYPADFNKWEYILKIANKHWIDWWYDLWGVDKPHFQDNWKPYIPKKIPMNIEQYWKLIIKEWLWSYPSSIYWIPVRLAKTDSKTLMWKANVKWYAPWITKDEILIFENTFKRWEDYLYKVLMHEFSHFIYHRYLDNWEETKMFFDDWKSYWNNLYKYIPSYISNYASTQPAEDFAELIWYSHYISNEIELPSKCNFEEEVAFKYEIATKLYIAWLAKHKKVITQ